MTKSGAGDEKMRREINGAWAALSNDEGEGYIFEEKGGR